MYCKSVNPICNRFNCGFGITTILFFFLKIIILPTHARLCNRHQRVLEWEGSSGVATYFKTCAEYILAKGNLETHSEWGRIYAVLKIVCVRKVPVLANRTFVVATCEGCKQQSGGQHLPNGVACKRIGGGDGWCHWTNMGPGAPSPSPFFGQLLENCVLVARIPTNLLWVAGRRQQNVTNRKPKHCEIYKLHFEFPELPLWATFGNCVLVAHPRKSESCCLFLLWVWLTFVGNGTQSVKMLQSASQTATESVSPAKKKNFRLAKTLGNSSKKLQCTFMLSGVHWAWTRALQNA